MQRVIYRSVIITLEVVPSGVSKCTAEHATAAIIGEWLQAVRQQIVQHIAAPSSMPNLEIYMRQLPLAQGAYVQILLCWIVLQSHHWEISDFNRPT